MTSIMNFDSKQVAKDSKVNPNTIISGLGPSWFEDLSNDFLNECLDIGIGVVGCTANDTWDDTLETMENLQTVKKIVREHGHSYIVENKATLEVGISKGDVGVILGIQNPKAMSDSINF